MWDHWDLTTHWVSTACYGDSCTLFGALQAINMCNKLRLPSLTRTALSLTDVLLKTYYKFKKLSTPPTVAVESTALPLVFGTSWAQASARKPASVIFQWFSLISLSRDCDNISNHRKTIHRSSYHWTLYNASDWKPHFIYSKKIHWISHNVSLQRCFKINLKLLDVYIFNSYNIQQENYFCFIRGLQFKAT
jgi:hypothetical protein